MTSLILTKLNHLVPGLTPVACIKLLPAAKAAEQLQLVTDALKLCSKTLLACEAYENSCAVQQDFTNEYDIWLLMEDELKKRRRLLAKRSRQLAQNINVQYIHLRPDQSVGTPPPAEDTTANNR